jgi:plasmid replication initiation protein
MDTEKFLVTKSNHLVEAGYRLSLNEQRLVLMAISKLDGRKPIPRDNDFTITAQEFSSMFSVPIKQAYESLENAASRLYEQDIKTYDGKHNTRERFRWVDGVKYWDGEGKVTLSFSNKIIPYLTLLHTQLTSYDLKQISNLNSSYAIRFYELMIQFRSTGERWMKLDTLKERLQLQDQYPRFFDLKKRIIEPAITEINNSTNLIVKWGVVKKGRVITGLNFEIKEKSKQVKLSNDYERCPYTRDMFEEGVV